MVDWNMNASLAQRTMDAWLNHQNDPYTDAMAAKSKEIKTASLQPLLKAIKGKGLSELTDPEEQAMWVRLYSETNHSPNYDIWRPDGTTTDIARKQPTPQQVKAGQPGDPAKIAWGSNDSIMKAISIMKDGSLENISDNLGDKHKVRNFYNNIVSPNGERPDVTVDTHAVAAGLWRPLAGDDLEPSHNFGSGKRPVKDENGNIIEPGIPSAGSNTNDGVSGTYGLYADAYRKAAARLGEDPNRLQSITWEGIRSLFPDTFKTAANKATIDGIWRKVDSGEFTVGQARRAVIDAVAQAKKTDRLGAFTRPEWLGDTGIHEAQGAPANPQNVAGTELPVRGARAAGGGARSGNPRGTAQQIIPPSLRSVIRK